MVSAPTCSGNDSTIVSNNISSSVLSMLVSVAQANIIRSATTRPTRMPEREADKENAERRDVDNTIHHASPGKKEACQIIFIILKRVRRF